MDHMAPNRQGNYKGNDHRATRPAQLANPRCGCGVDTNAASKQSEWQCDLNANAKLANRNKSNLEEIVAGWIVGGLMPTPMASD